MEKKPWWVLKLFVWGLLGLLSFIPHAESQSGVNAAKLQVEITGVRNDRGVLLISLYNQEEGFPDNPSRSISKRMLKSAAGKVITEWSELAAGSHAIAVLHDENSDGKMNTNLIGIPIEGFGFSNNKLGLAGPPSFQRASIELKRGFNKTIIKLRY